jgi:hypothetical protein
MTLQEVLKANPDGFTLDIETKKLVTKDYGYFVAMTDNELYSLDDCDKFLKAFNQLQNACKRKLFIGGWRDEDGKYYLDIAIYATSLAVASMLAEVFSQKAIYDCKAQSTIYI